MITPIQQVNVNLATRYLEIVATIRPNTNPADPTSIQHIEAMCRHLIDHPDMLLDKQSRWLGYIQGVLAVRGHLNVMEERDLTRPMYHEAYRAMNIDPPESVGLTYG